MTKSRDYWITRQNEAEAKMHKKSKSLEKALKQEYLIAEKNIKNSINDLVATYMSDNNLSYSEAVKYLTKSEWKVFRMSLEDYVKEIKRLKAINPTKAEELLLELNTVSMKNRITRLDSLLIQVNHELNTTAFSTEKNVKKLVSDVYAENFTTLTSDLGVKRVNTILPTKDIERLMKTPWSGANFSERIWNNRDRVAQTMKEEIIQQMIQGTNARKLTQKVRERLGADYDNAERLARTELNYALNQSSKVAYEEAGVKRYEYNAEQGERTCKVCLGMDGSIYNLDDFAPGVNAPPMHPRCRCTHLPVIEEI